MFKLKSDLTQGSIRGKTLPSDAFGRGPLSSYVTAIRSSSQCKEVIGCRSGKTSDIVFAPIDVMENLDSKDAACFFLIFKRRGHMLPSEIKRPAHCFQRFRIVNTRCPRVIGSFKQEPSLSCVALVLRGVGVAAAEGSCWLK